MAFPYTGGCQCGAIRYEVRGEPLTLYACHCTECQRQSGSAFGMSMPVPSDAVTILQGEPKQWSRVSASDREVICCFCGECGTRLFHRPTRNPNIVNIKPGTLDDTSGLQAVGNLWLRSAQPWIDEYPDKMLNYAGQPTSSEFTQLYEKFSEVRSEQNRTMPEPLNASELRQRCRQGEWDAPTPGLAPGYVQGNLVILSQADAFDFLRFCQFNPKPCPVLDVTDTGDPEPRRAAPGADLRTDLPRYRIFRHGELVEEVAEITQVWREDMVAFLLGCSFTFEAAMVRSGLPVRHIEEGKNVPMYITDRPCVPAGRFSGPLVVSMRPMCAQDAIQAVRVTGEYPHAHGAPVHLGDPTEIGISQLDRPDFGDSVTVHPGEIPVFWACGVTPQMAIAHAKPELAITHAPGHMFVTDLPER